MKCCRKVYLDWGTGWQDVSHLVKSDTLTITKRAASNTYHKAQNYVSFTLIYEQATFQAIYDATEKIKVQVVSQATESLFPSDTLYPDNTLFPMDENAIRILFTGLIPPTASRTYNGILDNTMLRMEGVDSQDLLDVEVGDWYLEDCTIMNPLNKSKSIIHQLAYIAGFTDSQIDQTITINKHFDAFAPNSEKDKILSIMDILLFEHGYVFNMNAEDEISPVQWIGVPSITYTFEEEHIVKEISVREKERTYDAIEITWYELNTMDNVRIYTESLPYASNGQFEGYPVPSTYYYPVEANVTDRTTGNLTLVYQDYTDTGIEYKTNEAILNNLDYNYKAFDSDFSSIIITKNHVLYDDKESLTLIASEFGNKKARVLYRNNQATSQNLYYMYINATVTYKSSERVLKAGLESTSEMTDKYESYFIYDTESADILAQNMVQMYGAGNVEYEFDSEIEVPEGSFVNLVTNDDTNLTCFITERQYNEKTGLFSYTLVGYSYNEGVIISEEVVKSAGAYEAYATAVAADAQAAAVAAQATADSKITVAQVPEYRGRYLNAGPTTDNNNGDTCTVYSTVSGTRGIYKYTTSWAKQTAPTMEMLSNAWVDICTVTTSGMITGAPYGVVEDYIGSQVNFIESLVANQAFINELRTKTIQFTESVSAIEGVEVGDTLIYIGKDPRHPEDSSREYEMAIARYNGENATGEVWQDHFKVSESDMKLYDMGVSGDITAKHISDSFDMPKMVSPSSTYQFSSTSVYGSRAFFVIEYQGEVYGLRPPALTGNLEIYVSPDQGLSFPLSSTTVVSGIGNIYDAEIFKNELYVVATSGNVYKLNPITGTYSAVYSSGYTYSLKSDGTYLYAESRGFGYFAYSSNGTSWTTNSNVRSCGIIEGNVYYGTTSWSSPRMGSGGDSGFYIRLYEGTTVKDSVYYLGTPVKLLSGATASVQGIYSIDYAFGWVYTNADTTSGVRFIRTADCGRTWFEVDTSSISGFVAEGFSELCIRENLLFMYGISGGTYYSFNRGEIWYALSYPGTNTDYGVACISNVMAIGKSKRLFLCVPGTDSYYDYAVFDSHLMGDGIIDMGASDDGTSHYTLFSNGTLICRSSTIFVGPGTQVLFPYLFQNTNDLTLCVSVCRGDPGRITMPYDVTTSGFYLDSRYLTGGATGAYIHYIAIGRAAT